MGRSGRKKTRLPFFGWSAGRIQLLLFLNCLLPTTLPYQNIKCNLSRVLIIQYDPEWIATTPCLKRAAVRLPHPKNPDVLPVQP
ncbi:hypothetical protein [Aneurinibacillus migulanus]|uniref:Uncharacterized protein n=1 Tax=Aneurinibacillus migulanus TaxID=47500 RepID=A0A0D1Y8E9_ANEMI|nr:hypothetical protein [Aneurinibacillus migulanus]KIV55412.1 hypothetical protein TS65_16275 [Aneurinibacillus migulanus]KON95023.1 hypothetical protein AF333_05525 [Aneurinibacillus migulanus]MED0892027.1 hypothetical protein [Aneurinibacillus migulanus]MED1618335.1 hypothetical protein [Aneurinibacillus migulanus]SDK45173.1 hypothetical protein SAMN04487909_15617 [Aneurinibacillus migulanus]